MKANELMVGDWLKHANGKYYRVTRIDILGDYNSIHYACGFPHLWEYNNKFEPIPLTPDILKKNGFVEWRDKCYRWEYAEGIYINADFTAEEPWAHISNRCYSATPVCRYVHELQHALRLCEIDKTIEL